VNAGSQAHKLTSSVADKRGKLIVLEGPEGAGKTTQHRRVSEWLRARGHTVAAFREPGGTALGDDVRRLLLDSPDGYVSDGAEALLYMASRAELVERAIRPALAEGAIVVLDRFFLATYAYQVTGRGLPEPEVRAANQLAAGGLVPDLTLLLMLPAADGLARADRRGERDRLERADAAFHERVARAYADFANERWQLAHPECGAIVAVDARGSEAEVFARVVEVLRRRWPETFP
jgi:dTMP kinase